MSCHTETETGGAPGSRDTKCCPSRTKHCGACTRCLYVVFMQCIVTYSVDGRDAHSARLRPIEGFAAILALGCGLRFAPLLLSRWRVVRWRIVSYVCHGYP